VAAGGQQTQREREGDYYYRRRLSDMRWWNGDHCAVIVSRLTVGGRYHETSSRSKSARLFVAPGGLAGVFECRIIVFECVGAFVVADAAVGHVSFTPASRGA